MAAHSGIDLLIPGLFGPIPVLPGELPIVPSLSRLLARVERQRATVTDPVSFLFDRFGLPVGPDRDPPSAVFSRLADMPDAKTDGFWLHADPVHLRPDRDRLLLFDARHLGVEREEADSLVALFNGHFAPDGLRLEAPASDRWYLQADRPPRIRTSAPADVVGRSVERSFLQGEEAKRWAQWLNEAQMLFHQSEVNRRREAAGRPAISGIWPWGGGSFPETMPQSGYRLVLSGDPLAVGLARAAGVEDHPLPDSPGELSTMMRGGRALMLWGAFQPAVLDGDARAWVKEFSRLEAWIGDLLGRVGTGGIGELVLYPCDGTGLWVTRGALRRFWRRPVDIARLVSGMTEA